MGEMKQRDATRALVGCCQILLIPSTRTSLEGSDAAHITSAAELGGYKTGSPDCTRNVSEQMWWRDDASGRGDFRSCQMGPIEQDLVKGSFLIRPYGGTNGGRRGAGLLAVAQKWNKRRGKERTRCSERCQDAHRVPDWRYPSINCLPGPDCLYFSGPQRGEFSLAAAARRLFLGECQLSGLLCTSLRLCCLCVSISLYIAGSRSVRSMS